MALKELFADNCPLGPEAGEVPLAPLVSVQLNQLFQGYQILAGGLEENNDLVEVDWQGERFKWENASLVRDSVL